MIHMAYVKHILALSLCVFLLSGCIQSPQNGNTPPENTNSIPSQPSITCGDYCPSQPHAQCVGKWVISGSYPQCTCSFECTISPPANDTSPDNQTDTGENGQAGQNLTDEGVNITYDGPITTVPALLDGEMSKIRNEFYSSHDGTFQEKSYVWRKTGSGSSDEIGLVSPATDVRFGGNVIDAVEASGFYVFTDTSDDSSECRGSAIFRGVSTPLDAYTSTDSFSVDYFPSIIDKKLRDCTIENRDYSKDASGWLITYSFRCLRVVDK